MKKRDKTITRTIPALFPEKQVAQKVLSPDATQSQMGDLPMPARAAALSKHDVLWMLQETEGNPETSMSLLHCLHQQPKERANNRIWQRN